MTITRLADQVSLRVRTSTPAALRRSIRTGWPSRRPAPSCLASSQRDPLRAADDPLLLGAAGGVDQSVEVCPRRWRCRRGRESSERSRGLGREDRRDREVDELAGLVASGAGRSQVSNVCPSHSSACGAFQGASGGTAGRHRVQVADRRQQLDERGAGGGRDRPVVGLSVCRRGSRRSRRRCRSSNVFSPSSSISASTRSWVGPTHWPPISTISPVADVAVEGPAADPVAGLEHDDRVAGGRRPRGRR